MLESKHPDGLYKYLQDKKLILELEADVKLNN